MSPLVVKVKEFLEAHDLGAKPGIVAVSGGPDSVALLRAMCELNVPVTVAHVNHQLRGAESDGDEEFVKALAEQLNVPFASTRITLPDGNVESAARKARYDWLNSLDGEWIATGHTLDDQAETVLHRIIRGTGIPGLCGIADWRPMLNNVIIVRPMLMMTRLDVLHYLASIGQKYRHDSTNDSLRLTRNRIRHQVLPLLKSFNPDVVAALARLAEQAQNATDALSREAEKLLEEVEHPRAGPLVIINTRRFILSKETINDIVHPHLVREMFRVIWEREDWPQGRMNYEQWDRLLACVIGAINTIDLPGGIRARRIGEVVQLGPSK